MRHRRYNPNWNQARVGGPGLEQLKGVPLGPRAAYLTPKTCGPRFFPVGNGACGSIVEDATL